MGLAAAIGVAAVGSSVLSSSSSNKAANKAAQTQAENTAANNALTKEIYAENKGVLSPFVQTGTAAGALLNDFYGIQTPRATVPSVATGTPGSTMSFGGGFGGIRDVFGGMALNGTRGMDWAAYIRGDTPAPSQQTQPVAPAQPIGTASRNAFSGYLANSDYAFQQATGNNAVNSGYAGAGTVQSGAAMKALEKYRQDLQSGYRNQWASGVANQQGVGLGAASALAGVGQNYVNTISANNTAAADARSNAALRQQNVFGNALGTFAGIGLGGGFG